MDCTKLTDEELNELSHKIHDEKQSRRVSTHETAKEYFEKINTDESQAIIKDQVFRLEVPIVVQLRYGADGEVLSSIYLSTLIRTEKEIKASKEYIAMLERLEKMMSVVPKEFRCFVFNELAGSR